MSVKGTYKHVFIPEFEYEGIKYSEVNFEFGDLTGEDMIKIETEMTDQGEFTLSPEVSRTFQCRLAARASGIPHQALAKAPIKDFIKITNAARNFLFELG